MAPVGFPLPGPSFLGGCFRSQAGECDERVNHDISYISPAVLTLASLMNSLVSFVSWWFNFLLSEIDTKSTHSYTSRLSRGPVLLFR